MSEAEDKLIPSAIPWNEEQKSQNTQSKCKKCGLTNTPNGKKCGCAAENQPGGFFLDTNQGVYFTYRVHDIKIAMVRAVMRVVVLLTIFLLYFVFWGTSDVAILGLTLGSCAGTFIGLDFLLIPCWAGVIASLLRGFTLGSQIATIDVHWKI